jgi:hypothetical protein
VRLRADGPTRPLGAWARAGLRWFGGLGGLGYDPNRDRRLP